jgi:hypothetical protein
MQKASRKTILKYGNLVAIYMEIRHLKTFAEFLLVDIG